MKPRNIDFRAEHGGRVQGLDFSISVNPYQPEWKDEMFHRARNIADRYVYWENLEENLSDLVGEDITVVAGATEALYLIPILFPAERALIPQYTYSEYERIARFYGFDILKSSNNPLELSEKVERNSIVFFCNPNNPDGRYFPPESLRPLIDAVEEKDSLLVLDEAFMDFVKDYRTPEGENIIKLRTFTKSYGMPGVRVGYISGFTDHFKKIRMPWSIGSLGYAFLEMLLEDSFRFIEETMPLIWEERKRFEVFGLKTDSNFFLMKKKGAYEYLRQKGLIVRDCTSFGLKDYIRFSIRKPEENDRLIEALYELREV